MGLDLQPDGLTAGLAGHCQRTKNIHSLSWSQKEKEMICTFASTEIILKSSALMHRGQTAFKLHAHSAHYMHKLMITNP